MHWTIYDSTNPATLPPTYTVFLIERASGTCSLGWWDDKDNRHTLQDGDKWMVWPGNAPKDLWYGWEKLRNHYTDTGPNCRRCRNYIYDIDKNSLKHVRMRCTLKDMPVRAGGLCGDYSGS